MTALERAARYIAHQAAATALVIVPLATASSASAAVILDPGTATPTGGGAVSPLPGGSASFVTVANGGIKYFGSESYSVAASGGGFEVGLILEGTGSGTLDMSSIGAHFDYTLSGQSTDLSSFSATIDFLINGVVRGSAAGLGASASGNVLLGGWTTGEALTSWKVVLQGSFGGGGGDVLTLDVPDHSISLTPAGASVPEPALLLLTMAGAVVALRRRRH
jgi:hypothetical protein